MIYLSFIEFTSHGEREGDDTAGSFTVACEAANSREVVDIVLSAKLKEVVAGKVDYTEFYLKGIVELPTPLKAPVVLGIMELDADDEPAFTDIYLEQDEEHVRGIRSTKIGDLKPFFVHGEPPAYIVERASEG